MEGVRLVKTVIKAGAVLDVPNTAEMTDIARQVWREHASEDVAERTRARGIKYIRVSGIGPTPAAQTFYIPNGPEEGYIWALRILSVQLAAADTLLSYITSSAPQAGATPQRLLSPFGTSNANQVALFATAQAMLYGGESVYLSAAAHNITAFYMGAWQVPTEMEWKLL